MLKRKQNTIADYERVIRKHRQNVFDEKTGEKHEAAIVKLKASKVMQAVFAENRANAEQRLSDKLLSMYA
jgi:replication fork clamp-binding protein CrfC